MTRKKKTLIIFGGIVGGIIHVILAIILIMLIFAGAIHFILFLDRLDTTEPSKPFLEVEEFPFKLDYEINGNSYRIRDTLVIEQHGTDDGSTRKIDYEEISYTHRGKISPDAEIYSLPLVEEEEYSIHFCVGDYDYYMNGEQDSPDEIDAGEIYISPGNRVLTEEELYENYGIKILDVDITPSRMWQTPVD